MGALAPQPIQAVFSLHSTSGANAVAAPNDVNGPPTTVFYVPQDCKCGDDVTLLAYQSLSQIAEAYGNLSLVQREIASLNMFWNFYLGQDSWDMKWLLTYGVPNETQTSFPQACYAMCGVDGATVTFEGNCVNVQELNYLMFGLGIKLAYDIDPLDPLTNLETAFFIRDPFGNDQAEQRKLAAAKYGYLVEGGINPGKLVHSSVREFKWPGACKRSRILGHNNVDNWVWEGIPGHGRTSN